MSQTREIITAILAVGIPFAALSVLIWEITKSHKNQESEKANSGGE